MANLETVVKPRFPRSGVHSSSSSISEDRGRRRESVAEQCEEASPREPVDCITTHNISISTRAATNKDDARPRQPVFLGSSNARRLLKRADLCKTENDQPIFIAHESSLSPTPVVSDDATPFADHNNTNYSLSSSTAPWRSALLGPPMGYSVEIFATYAEDEQKRKQAAIAQREKDALVASINTSRRAEGAQPLTLSPSLSTHAQSLAEELMREGDLAQTTSTVATSSIAADTNAYHPQTQASATNGASSVRLESPAGMGALAAVEMWYGGKYRQRCFTNAESTKVHRAGCACRLRAAFEVLTDSRWTTIGVGWSADGHWVVELQM